MGNITHSIRVSNVLASQGNFHDPVDDDTLEEITRAYDSRNRLIAQTIWNTPLGEVDPNNPPIGETVQEGQTTFYEYFSYPAGVEEVDERLEEAYAKLAEYDLNFSSTEVNLTQTTEETYIEIIDNQQRVIFSGNINTENALENWQVAKTFINQAGFLQTTTTKSTGEEEIVCYDALGNLRNETSPSPIPPFPNFSPLSSGNPSSSGGCSISVSADRTSLGAGETVVLTATIQSNGARGSVSWTRGGATFKNGARRITDRANSATTRNYIVTFTPTVGQAISAEIDINWVDFDFKIDEKIVEKAIGLIGEDITIEASSNPNLSGATYKWKDSTGKTLSSTKNLNIGKDISTAGKQTYTLEFTHNGNTLEKDFDINFVEVDLEMQGLNETQEESDGAIILVNNDDDDGSNKSDKDDKKGDDKVDFTKENDLIELKINTAQLTKVENLNVTLSIPNTVKVYMYADKSVELTLANEGLTWIDVEDIPSAVYIEGVKASSAIRDGEFKITVTGDGISSSNPIEDLVKATVYELDVVVQEVDSSGNGVTLPSGQPKFIPATELKVGKMEGAITGSGSSAVLDIDQDVDRFYITIFPIPSVMPEFKISTLNAKGAQMDAPNKFNFETTTIMVNSQARQHTKSMLLVADDVDDDHMNPSTVTKTDSRHLPADDTANDRTHKIELEGEINITDVKITQGGNTQTFNHFAGMKRVEKKRTVTFEAVIVKNHKADLRNPIKDSTGKIIGYHPERDSSGKVKLETPISEAQLNIILEHDRRVFFQIGVDLKWTVKIVEPPAYARGSFDLTDGLEEFLSVSKPTNEEIELLDKKSILNKNSSIQAFYINTLFTSFISRVNPITRTITLIPSGSVAEAFPEGRAPVKYVNNIILSSNSENGIQRTTGANPDKWTTVHELGHIFSLPHYSDRKNFIIDGNNFRNENKVSDSKRITFQQEKDIKNSRIYKALR